MDFTPQVETREIADSELDNVSGGVLGAAVGAVDSVSPVSVTGTLGTVTDTVEGTTGVNTAGVTSLAGL
ncbi:MAG: type A2 lantipeptide [Streptomyces sp.]|uniref:type A2 lantipeptide n=1 Tax=Streptomyces sp. TaxID=1931 RepID=UPI003D6AA100